jgi:hypothetical protein
MTARRLTKTDYQFGLGKEIQDFIKHRLNDFGPYGLQIVITPIKAAFKTKQFKVDIYTENSKGEQIGLVNSTVIESETRFHITDIAQAFKFEIN